MAELLSQQRCAEWLNLSTRQVRNLVKEGLPTTSTAGQVVYPWPACLHWYIEYKVRTATAPKPVAGSEDGKAARRREEIARADKAETDAERARHELQKELGTHVPVDFLAAQVETMLRNLRSGLLNFEGRWSPQLVGLESTAQVRAVLAPAIEELMLALTEAADQDPPLDDDAPADDPGAGGTGEDNSGAGDGGAGG